jgi:hypothetical protein
MFFIIRKIIFFLSYSFIKLLLTIIEGKLISNMPEYRVAGPAVHNIYSYLFYFMKNIFCYCKFSTIFAAQM